MRSSRNLSATGLLGGEIVRVSERGGHIVSSPDENNMDQDEAYEVHRETLPLEHNRPGWTGVLSTFAATAEGQSSRLPSR